MESMPARRDGGLARPQWIMDGPDLGAPNPPDAGGSVSFSFAEYFRTLWDHKGTIALLTVIGAAAAAIVCQSQPRMYRAEASLELLVPNEDFLSLRDIRATATPPMYSISAEDAHIKTQVEILQQEWLIARAWQRLQTEKKAGPPKPVRQRPGASTPPASAASRPALPSPAAAPVDKKTLRSVVQSLSIEPSHRSRIVRIAYESTDPKTAAAFPNALAQTFIEQSMESRMEGIRETRSLLQRQLKEIKGKLDKSQVELQAFSKSSGLLATPGQETVVASRLRLMQEALSKAEAERISSESALRVLEDQKGTTVDSDAIRQYRVTLTDLKRQLADLETIFTPENYRVTRLKAQIAEVERSIDQELAKAQRRIKGDFEAARQREVALAHSVDTQEQVVSTINSRTGRYEMLKDEVDITQKFYESIAQKVNEAEIASAIRPSDVRLLTPAEPPTDPYRPSLPLYAGLGTSLGLALGVAFVSVREHGVRRLRRPGDTGVYLNVPELGAIPAGNDLTSRLRSFWLGAGTAPVERISWEEKSSDVTESFRATLVSIFSTIKTGTAPRVILVTSPLPAEGKTTVVSNLGITLSDFRKRVVLIDGDLRRPRLHEVFCVENSHGLCSFLRGNTPAEGLSLEGLVHPTPINGLSVLPSGPIREDVGRLLHSDRLDRLLKRLLQEFDHVLIDAPPCLRLADARILAQRSDGVLVVLRANHSDEASALAAVQCFLASGIPVIGTILNDWTPPSSPDYGYGKHRLYPKPRT